MTNNTPPDPAGPTPGPWVAEPADMFGDHNIVLADQSEDRRAVAAVVSNMRDPAEVAANASVIAAAYCMLEALEGALPLLEKIEDAELVGDEGCLWPVEAVRAAIARAHTSTPTMVENGDG